MITNNNLQDVSHLMRYHNHGILISYKTLNSDNPRLNCRLQGLQKYSPKRIILDKNLNFNKNTFLINTAKKYLLIFFTIKITTKRLNSLKKKVLKQ